MSGTERHTHIDIGRLLQSFMSLKDMVFLMRAEEDGTFRCMDVNETYEKETGFKKERMINKSVSELLEPQEAELVVQHYEEAIATRGTITYEEAITIHHVLRVFETTIIPIFKDHTDHCVYVLGIARDITVKKSYEEEIVHMKNEFETIMHHQQGLTFKVEQYHNTFFYTFCDGQALDGRNHILRYIAGKCVDEVFDRELADATNKHYTACWNRQETVTFEFSLKNSPYIWYCTVSPIIQNGVTVALVGTAVDISEKKKTEAALVQAEKLALLGEMAAGIAHEIRNPLTTVRGFLKLMTETKRTFDDHTLHVLESEIESIERIVSEFMMLARPQAARVKTINVIPLMQDVLFLMKNELFHYGADVRFHYPADELLVQGDQHQLKQVFMNFVKNAMEAMIGRHTKHLTITCRTRNGKVIIIFEDSGCGIPAEQIRHLGEPFYTTKKRGNGLGLMISYRIIKHHEGFVLCESELHKGTTFTITFPSFSS